MMEMRSIYCCYSKSHFFQETRPNSASFPKPTHHPLLRFKSKHKKRYCVHWRRIETRGKNLMAITNHRRRKLLLVVMAAAKTPNKQGPEKKKKKGTILGAVSLIVGTSIGSGILALPQKTSPAGFIPSAVAITLCWLFLVIEALLLAEINVHLRKKWKKDEMQGTGDLEIISLRTMAEETLGEWGGILATITYLFLSYTSMVAYTSKSGDVLSSLISSIPTSISGILFTLLSALLILVGGTQITDRVNQWLTVSMICLLVVIEAVALPFCGWSYSIAISNWAEVPQTIPVIIFSLAYHDIAPVVCAYLGGDLMRVRISILLGSLVPLISLLIWDEIELGLFPSLDGIDPLESLARGRWSNMLPMVEVFSLLAVGTSLIGTLLGFSEFFKEQLGNLLYPHPSTRINVEESMDKFPNDKSRQDSGVNWWGSNKLAFFATSLAVFPSMLISTIVPDAFSVATDVAGGYCMTILFGVLPPAMAWVLHSRPPGGPGELSKAKPVLIGVGILSCGILFQQLFLDLTHPLHL